MAKKESDTKEEKLDVNKLKQELSEYIDKKIKDQYAEEIEKSKRRVIKRKNKKILIRNIIILILIAIIIYLLYLLNTLDYFDKYFYCSDIKRKKEVIYQPEISSLMYYENGILHQTEYNIWGKLIKKNFFFEAIKCIDEYYLKQNIYTSLNKDRD